MSHAQFVGTNQSHRQTLHETGTFTYIGVVNFPGVFLGHQFRLPALSKTIELYRFRSICLGPFGPRPTCNRPTCDQPPWPVAWARRPPDARRSDEPRPQRRLDHCEVLGVHHLLRSVEQKAKRVSWAIRLSMSGVNMTKAWSSHIAKTCKTRLQSYLLRKYLDPLNPP